MGLIGRFRTCPAQVTLMPQEAGVENSGKLFYRPGAVDAAVQIKTLISDVAPISIQQESWNERDLDAALWILGK